MTVDPSSSKSTATVATSDFLRNKAKAMASIHGKAKAAPGNEDTLITATAEMNKIFDTFIKGHADENAIAFPTAAEAAAYAEALDFLRKRESGKFVTVVVGVECYAPVE